VIFVYTIEVVMVLRQFMVQLCAKRAQHGQVADSGCTNSAGKWIFLSSFSRKIAVSKSFLKSMFYILSVLKVMVVV
jgi:hypothetical protein